MTINTIHPASNTGMSAMINTAQLISFIMLLNIMLLKDKGIKYALVGDAALLTIDDCQWPTDAFDFVIAKADIEQVSELTRESTNRSFGRYYTIFWQIVSVELRDGDFERSQQ